jgi:hypothetical protein
MIKFPQKLKNGTTLRFYIDKNKKRKRMGKKYQQFTFESLKEIEIYIWKTYLKLSELEEEMLKTELITAISFCRIY